MEDYELQPLILSSAIILPGESSENQCDAILNMMSHAGEQLNQWKG